MMIFVFSLDITTKQMDSLYAKAESALDAEIAGFESKKAAAAAKKKKS